LTTLRISYLHIAPELGNIEGNRGLIERGTELAASLGSDWVITPELCIPGYLFSHEIGTEWILEQPDEWMQKFCLLVKKHQLTMFLSHPERDSNTNQLFNSVFVIGPSGHIIGSHKKIKTLNGPEGWSSPGTECTPIDCNGISVGILVCADAYKGEISNILKDKGADILVSPSSWGPGGCGPDGEWERRSKETGLPVLVCNRTGKESDNLDMLEADSVVAINGIRHLTGSYTNSTILTFDLDLTSMTPTSYEYHKTDLFPLSSP
jgi:predicted amidohydrolase